MAGRVQGDVPIMPGHQGHYRLPEGGLRPETAEHVLRQPGALRRVAVKMALALLIYCKAVWLANIVEQGRQPQLELRRNCRKDPEGVLPHVIAVVAVSAGQSPP